MSESQHYCEPILHEQNTTALPSAAETCLLGLAKKVHTLPFGARQIIDHEYIHKMDEAYGLADARARLGELYPPLNEGQTMVAAQAFEQAYDSLPTSHPRHTGQHNHGHDEHNHDGCGKVHGPLRKVFERFERAVLGKISNQRAKQFAAVAFRGSALVFCPGDDIAALGLQVYGSAMASHSQEYAHKHEEPNAILPRRPRIDFETNKAIISLPVDAPVPHAELDNSAAGMLVRDHIADIKPEKKLTSRRAKKLAKRQLQDDLRWWNWVAKTALTPDHQLYGWAQEKMASRSLGCLQTASK